MPGPFIFIGNRLKRDGLDDDKKRAPGLVEFIETNEARKMASEKAPNDETQQYVAAFGDQKREAKRGADEETPAVPEVGQ